jgi:hypothetical protein
MSFLKKRDEKHHRTFLYSEYTNGLNLRLVLKISVTKYTIIPIH